tara:strand:- start:304 stop:546 length:243 start_codon:yes stop_codon:yes gene_type:complete
MDTKFVPFDLKTMDQAISFKTTDGDVVARITHFPRSMVVYPVADVSKENLIFFTTVGHEYTHREGGDDLLMEVVNTTYTR